MDQLYDMRRTLYWDFARKCLVRKTDKGYFNVYSTSKYTQPPSFQPSLNFVQRRTGFPQPPLYSHQSRLIPTMKTSDNEPFLHKWLQNYDRSLDSGIFENTRQTGADLGNATGYREGRGGAIGCCARCPGCELLRALGVSPHQEVCLGVNQISASDKNPREAFAGPFIKAMYSPERLLLVIFFFIQFKMATNLLRNVIVIGGSFVGRVSIESPSPR